MKKALMALMAIVVVVAVAMPAVAAVEFKYGGQFRVRYYATDHLDGTSAPGTNDNQNFVDSRLRLYFSYIASENLRVVTRFEVGDTVWGRSTTPTAGYAGRFGPGGGVGADAVNFETKNAYIEFNIPQTPLQASLGVQGVNLLNSWIIDDDFSAAVIKGKFDPVKVAVGYVAGQNNSVTTWQENIDSWLMSVDYAQGPLSATFVFYYQDGHNTVVSADPYYAATPIWGLASSSNATTKRVEADDVKTDEDVEFNVSVPKTWRNGVALPVTAGDAKVPTGRGSDFLDNAVGIAHGADAAYSNNQLFDLGLNLGYKLSWLSAYLTFVKNLGGVDVVGTSKSGNAVNDTADYTGWMIDGGANYFCGPYTLNLGGFYTTGNDIQDQEFHNLDGFVYPYATSKYFSEILGGGILDVPTTVGHTNVKGTIDHQWRGYQMPTNIWTVTVGGAWQALEKTKLSASYWYFGASEDVVAGWKANNIAKYANDIGHELNFYVTQGIVDGLTLDLVGAYLITGDAYTAAKEKEDVYELGARLQWNF